MRIWPLQLLVPAIAFGAPSIPIAFEQNAGQIAPAVRFAGAAPGFAIWLTDSGPVVAVDNMHGRAVLRMSFPGARKHPNIIGDDVMPARANHFAGNDPAHWRIGVPQYSAVRYREVYPGIDLVFRGAPLEYDWIVAPGGDPRRIQMSIEGASRIRIDDTGDLVLALGDTELRQHHPRILQGGREIGGTFIRKGRTIGFAPGAYDRSQALTIDPIVTYATYLGGTQYSELLASAFDPQGNIFLAGSTITLDYPTKAGLYPKAFGYYDAVVVKINPAASGAASLLWSTYLGGATGDDLSQSVATDSSGNVIVSGLTNSTDFPLMNSAQMVLNNGQGRGVTCLGVICRDAFVTKISGAGNSLLYSIFIGSSADDVARSVTVDASGDAWIGGGTTGHDLPLQGGEYQQLNQTPVVTGGTGMIAEIDPTGRVLYTTYFGGESFDEVESIALDSSGNVYVCGATSSATFPVKNPYIGSRSSSADGFVAELKPSIAGQASLLYSTYLGATGGMTDLPAVTVDSKGNIYVAGATLASNFPVTNNAVQKTAPSTHPSSNSAYFYGEYNGLGGNAVVTVLNPTLPNQLVYSTFLGGQQNNTAFGMGLDKSGRMVVIGFTDSPDFPTTPDAFEQRRANAGTTGFLSVIDPTVTSGNGLVYSTVLGGASGDAVYGLSISGSKVALASAVLSIDLFTTASAFQPASPGLNGNGYVTLFDLSVTGPVIKQGVNAASFVEGAGFSPGEMITFIGTTLGPPQVQLGVLDQNGNLATSLAGTQVLIDGYPAPIIYTLNIQTTAIVPYEVAAEVGKTVYAQLIVQGVASNLFAFTVVPSAPGIFSYNSSGSGPGAILNQDGSVNTASNPAAKGSIVSIFLTGEGQLNPPGADGRIENGPTYPTPQLPVSVSFGGIASPQIEYAGTAPGGVDGFMQINATIPPNVPSGNAQVVVTIGTASSPSGITVTVQ